MLINVDVARDTFINREIEAFEVFVNLNQFILIELYRMVPKSVIFIDHSLYRAKRFLACGHLHSPNKV